MKGKLKKIDDKWFVEYSGISYKGGTPKRLGSYTIKVEKKTLPLHLNFITMTHYVWVKGIKVYDGDKVEFTQVLVNPMGREVDPNDLGQNHSKCVWYAKPSLEDKEDLGYTTKTGIKVSDEMVRATMVPKEYFGKEEDLMMEVPMAQYSKDETKKLFTDYPITELGDEEFKEAPIRECELLFYDDNKYCYVKVGGIEKEIKRGYIYTKPGRCGEVDCISIDEINKLIEVNKQKQHLIDMMESDEELGLYDEEIEPYENYLKRLKDRRTEDNYKYSDEDFEKYDEYIKDCWKGNMSVYKCLEFMYFAEKEIKVEDVFNDEKRERANRMIQQHKVLKDLTLINPAHLIMTSDGYGEFPDGYTLTEKGIQYIIEQLNKE